MELEQNLNLDFTQEGDRFQARQQLTELFAAWFSNHDYPTASFRLEEAGVCWGPYQTIQQMVDKDPDCSEDNPLFNRVEQPGIGSYLMPSQPLNFTGLDRESVWLLLDRHTELS